MYHLMDSLIDSLLSRRTIRKYKPQPIPSTDLQQIIACAQRAPSGAGLQTYTFIRITDSDLRQHIAEIAGSQTHVCEAGEFFVICADVYRDKTLIAHRGGHPSELPLMSLLYGLTDAIIAASFMVAASEALGYGTCFIGGIKNALDEVIRLLALPEGVLPIVGVCIGVSDENPAQRPRLPVDLVVRENNYVRLTSQDLEHCLEAQADASTDSNWYDVVNRYWGSGNDVMTKREEIAHRALVQQGFWPGGESDQSGN
jgi:FMN reductase (NADPH)